MGLARFTNWVFSLAKRISKIFGRRPSAVPKKRGAEADDKTKPDDNPPPDSIYPLY